MNSCGALVDARALDLNDFLDWQVSSIEKSPNLAKPVQMPAETAYFGNQQDDRSNMELDMEIDSLPCSQHKGMELDILCSECFQPMELDVVQTTSCPAFLPHGLDGWTPGEDVCGFIGRERHGKGFIAAQSQVLLCNAYIRCSKLPRAKQQMLRGLFPPVGSTRSTTLAAQIVSGVTCVNARTVEAIYEHLKLRKSQPCVRPVVLRQGATAPGLAAKAASAPEGMELEDMDIESGQSAPAHAAVIAPEVPKSFLNLVKLTQFMSTHGLSKSLLPHLCFLVIESKGDVGHSNHHADFCSAAEFQANWLLTEAAKKILMQPLGGTGVLPDVALILDAGTVGKFYRQCRDTVLLVGLLVPVDGPPYVTPIFVDAIVESADGRQAAVIKFLEQAMDTLGLGNLWKWLAERLAVMCGDGGYIEGGLQAKHHGAALKDIWGVLENRNIWDLFHLIDKAGSKAIKGSEMANFFLLYSSAWSRSLGLGKVDILIVR